jgi:hypothetical protein
MANVVELNYEQVHKFVDSNKKMGFFWDGWTLVKWSPGHNGYTQPNGMFRNNKWGYAHKFYVNKKGNWVLPEKYVKNT